MKDKKPTIATKGTAVPPFHLIPRNALLSFVRRFEKGVISFDKGAWNASMHQEPFAATVLDDEWVIARLSHVIDHATKAIAKIQGHLPDDGDDDAGAIMFGGAVLAERRYLKDGL